MLALSTRAVDGMIEQFRMLRFEPYAPFCGGNS